MLLSYLDRFRLDGRNAVVTGAGNGLGRAIARGLAECGANVACLDIEMSKAEETCRTIQADGGYAQPFCVDISNPGLVERVREEVETRHGETHILFNVAGIAGVGARLHEVETAEWRRRLGINLDGAFFMSKAFLPGMVRRKDGAIVHIASVYGLLASAKRPLPDYAAAKAALIGLTREMAVEYAADHIRVNAIAPGFFRTSLSPRMKSADFGQNFVDRIPLGRVGEPEDIVNLAIFLASPASSYVTGQTIVIDGGFSLV